jgi:hypothetical protein
MNSSRQNNKDKPRSIFSKEVLKKTVDDQAKANGLSHSILLKKRYLVKRGIG